MLDACVRVFSVLCTVNALTHVARMYKVYLPGAGAELQCYRRVNWLTQLWQQAATTKKKKRSVVAPVAAMRSKNCVDSAA